MKNKHLIIKHLEKLRKSEKSTYHKLAHTIHKKHKISKKTLFYVKEYGPHSHALKTIFKESIKILLLASVISSLGGLALESIKTIFVSILPLIILLPSLNGMIGNYGIVISSRFSTMLHEGKIKRKWWLNKELKHLFIHIFLISILIAIFSLTIALLISYFSDYGINSMIIYKLLFIILADIISLVCILFLISIIAGRYYFKKKEDPNNFLIPITTSIADFGNMLILSGLVLLIF